MRLLTYLSGRNDLKIARSAFLAISNTCPPGLGIFPNIQVLSWTRDPEFLNLFMHGHISQFLGAAATTASQLLFPLNLTPNLLHLKLHVRGAIQPELLELIRGLRRLKSIVLGKYQFTDKVIECLSGLPDIAAIIVKSDPKLRGARKDIYSFTPSIPEGAFTSLVGITLDVQFHEAQTFLKALPVPNKLFHFCISSPKFETRPLLVS